MSRWHLAMNAFATPMSLGLTTVKPGELESGLNLDSGNPIRNQRVREGVDAIKEKILTTGKVIPLSVAADGFIVDGEHRYRALMDLGVTDIPVYVGEQLGSSGRLKKNYSGLPVDVNIPQEH